jgi:hypothetical protein
MQTRRLRVRSPCLCIRSLRPRQMTRPSEPEEEVAAAAAAVVVVAEGAAGAER